MHTYAYTNLSLGVLLSALFLVIKSVRKDQRKVIYQLCIQKTGLHFFFGAVLAFLIFQLMPLPPFLVAFLSPEAGVVWQKSLPAQGFVGGGSIADSWHSLAPYSYPVRMSIIRWVVYGLFFFGLAHVLNSRKRILFMVYLLLLLGCFEALYGLIQAHSGDGHVLWKSYLNQGMASGTYINRNHFAGFMEMGLLLAAGFAISLMDPKKEKRAGSKKPLLKAALSDLLSEDQWVQKRILVLFAGVVMGLGVVFSGSRAGIMAAAGGLLCMGLLLVFKKGQKGSGVVLLAIFLITGSYSLNIGMHHVFRGFESIESSYEERTRLARKTMDMFYDYQIAGVGVGNFQYAYPRYQSEKDLKEYVRFAHNDWVQFLSEAGVIGFVLLLAGMGLYLYTTIRLWWKRSDPFAVGLGIVPVPVLAVMAVHSFSDFNLHIPANFLVLVAIMAIGHAALRLERHHRGDRMDYRYHHLPLKYRGGVVLALLLGLIGWSGYWSVRHFMAEAYCNTVPNSTLNRDQNPPVGEVVAAIGWDSSNAGYWYKLGNRQRSEVRGQRSETDGSRKDAKAQRGGDGGRGSEVGGQRSETEIGVNPRNLRNLRIMALEKSVELNPFDAQYHLRLGWEYAHLWKEADYHTKWLPAADISMDRAAYFAGVKNPHLHQELGNYWTMRSKSVMPNNPLHHEAWAKAIWHYQKAQSLEKGGTLKQIREYVRNFYPDEGLVDEFLAPR